MQERLGFYSFCQGDHVFFKAVEDEGPTVDMIVVSGVIYKDARGAEQGRKYLVLYELQSQMFFLGNWTQYVRCVKQGYTQNTENAESGALVNKVADDVKSRMLKSFEANCEIQQLTGPMLKKRSDEPPPSIKHARAQFKKRQRAQMREDAKLNKKKNRANKRGKRGGEVQPNADETTPTEDSGEKPITGDGGDEKTIALEAEAVKMRAELARLHAALRAASSKRGTEVIDVEVANKTTPEPVHGHNTDVKMVKAPGAHQNNNYTTAALPPVAPTFAVVPPRLPPGWKQHTDVSNGNTYYYNTDLNTSQWELPSAESSSPPLPPSPPREKLPDSAPMQNIWSTASTSQSHYASKDSYTLWQQEKEATRLRGTIPYLEGFAKASAAGE